MSKKSTKNYAETVILDLSRKYAVQKSKSFSAGRLFELKVLQKLRSLLLLIMIMIFSFLSNTASFAAENYTLEMYEEALASYNKSHDTNFVIKDYDLFYKNVYCKLSPSELTDTLYSSLGETKIINAKNIMTIRPQSEPDQDLTYKMTLTQGTYNCVVYARIQTRFAGTKKYFSKYITAGTLSGYTNYDFRISKCTLKSFSATLCVVKMEGTWVNRTTGIQDLVYRTYEVPFTP